MPEYNWYMCIYIYIYIFIYKVRDNFRFYFTNSKSEGDYIKFMMPSYILVITANYMKSERFYVI